MTSPYVPRVINLPSLLTQVMIGRISVAMFQREFVWTDRQRIELVESVTRNHPIGALFTWQTQRRYETQDALGPVRVLRPESTPPFPEYLVDGMQRLTTLYAALAPGLAQDVIGQQHQLGVDGVPETPVGFLRDKAADGRSREDWEMFADVAVDEESIRIRTPTMRRKGKLPASWVPLADILDQDRVDELRVSKDFKDNPGWKRRLSALRKTLFEYPIVLIPMVTEDRSDAVAAFTRINRGGTPMDETSLVHAKVWQFSDGKVDVLKRFAKLNERLAPFGFQDLPDAVPLNAVILTAGEGVGALKRRDEDAVARLIAESPDDLLGRTEQAMIKAARFLHSGLRVCGLKVLPSNWHMLFLVTQADALDETDHAQVERARQWFMSTAYSEVLGLNLGVQDELADFTRRVFPKEADAPLLLRSEPVAPVQQTGRFDLRSSRNKAFALWLLTLVAEHSAEDLAELAVFLGRNGMQALPRLVEEGDPNLPEGRVLIDPRELDTLRNSLRRPSGEIEATLARHAISTAAHRAYQDGLFAEFLVARRAHIDALEACYVKSLGLRWLLDE
jgi:hypothetical protein